MQGPGISLIHRHQHLSLSLFPLLPPLHLCESEPSADADSSSLPSVRRAPEPILRHDKCAEPDEGTAPR